MKPVKHWKKEDLIEFIKGVDKKTWAVGMASVIAAVLLWTGFIGPAWFDRPRLRRETQSMDSQIRRFHELNKKRLVWEENEKIFGKLIADTKARVYKESESALLLGEVSRIARDAGVDVVASKPKKESSSFPEPYGEKLQAISYDFTVQGGYHSLGRFAAGIESHSKLLRIRSVHVAPVDDDSGKLLAEYGLAAIAEQTAPPPKSAKKTAKAANAKKK